MHLQHLGDPLSTSDKDLFDVTGDGLGGRYVVVWSSHLHQGLKPTIFDDFEGMHTFSYPSDNLSASGA